MTPKQERLYVLTACVQRAMMARSTLSNGHFIDALTDEQRAPYHRIHRDLDTLEDEVRAQLRLAQKEQ